MSSTDHVSNDNGHSQGADVVDRADRKLECSFCGSVQLEDVTTTSRAQLLADYKVMHGLSFPAAILESNFPFEHITTKRCRQCGTLLYDPMVAGDGAYYEFLSKSVSWYYSQNRWEYPITVEILERERPKLFLEVGCGAGHFLRLARSRGYEGDGCDLNPRHLATLRAEGFRIFSGLEQTASEYDALVMFQVLEHLVDPYSFLKALLSRVAPGGLVILSTPVSPSCVAFANPPFALPPHHQWMPSTQGFRLLAGRLGLTCEDIACDPPDYTQVIYGLKKRCGLPSDLKYLPYHWRLAGRMALRMATLLGWDWAKVGHTGVAVLRKPSLTE